MSRPDTELVGILLGKIAQNVLRNVVHFVLKQDVRLFFLPNSYILVLRSVLQRIEDPSQTCVNALCAPPLASSMRGPLRDQTRKTQQYSTKDE